MTLLGLIRSLYPLRSCKFDLSDEKINSAKYKVCLEYHMGNCLAPCTSQINQSDYNNNIKEIREIIKGNFKSSLNTFKNQMKGHAKAMEFEKAQLVKEKIQSLNNFQAKSTIVNTKINNVDVFSIISDEDYGYINYLQVSHGSIVRSHTLEVKKKLDESNATLLQLGIIEIRQLFKSDAKEVFLPELVPLGEALKISVPLQGDKRKLVDLSTRNAKFF